MKKLEDRASERARQREDQDKADREKAARYAEMIDALCSDVRFYCYSHDNIPKVVEAVGNELRIVKKDGREMKITLGDDLGTPYTL